VKFLALVLLLPLLLSCGNKGDLYLEADPTSEQEFKEAAEKLKKKKPNGAQTQ